MFRRSQPCLHQPQHHDGRGVSISKLGLRMDHGYRRHPVIRRACHGCADQSHGRPAHHQSDESCGNRQRSQYRIPIPPTPFCIRRPLTQHWPLNTNAPNPARGIVTQGAHLAADIYHKIITTRGHQIICHFVHTQIFGQCGQVHIHLVYLLKPHCWPNRIAAAAYPPNGQLGGGLPQWGVQPLPQDQSPTG